MDRHQAEALIAKYNAGHCTEEEKSLVEQWYNNLEYVADAPSADEIIDAKDKVWAQVVSHTQKSVKLWPRIAAAAVVLLVVGLSIFFFNRNTNTLRHPDSEMNSAKAGQNDIKPGSNKAYLILSNGKRLSLADVANGALAKEGDAEITKTADGQVIYESRHPELVSGSRTTYSNALNTIETPRGGQYQIRLPDGSKVWLNAASRLIYPVSFNGRGQRVVELSGEAYFEIFKNKIQPFVVKCKNQEVTVLGTHFNINSYSDEASVKTTLLEGSVRISALRHPESSPQFNSGSGSLTSKGGGPDLRQDNDRINGVVLKPGEQALLTNSKINVVLADLAETIAWQKGEFIFKEEALESIMKKISRWYDVDVVYAEGAPKNIKLGGFISRSRNLSAVLKMIELTKKVKFKVEGKKVTVLPVKK